MGSCTHYDTTLNQAIACEAGFGSGENTLVARGAGGGDFSQAYGGWAGSVWIAADNRNGERWLAEVLWARSGRDTTIKWVEESMGLGDFDIPENVWKHRPAEPPNEWAANWRQGVESFRAAFPDYVRHLNESHVGSFVYVHGHDASGPWVYLGQRRNRRSTVQVFVSPDGDIWRLPRREEQLRRCRISRIKEEA